MVEKSGRLRVAYFSGSSFIDTTPFCAGERSSNIGTTHCHTLPLCLRFPHATRVAQGVCSKASATGTAHSCSLQLQLTRKVVPTEAHRSSASRAAALKSRPSRYNCSRCTMREKGIVYLVQAGPFRGKICNSALAQAPSSMYGH